MFILCQLLWNTSLLWAFTMCQVLCGVSFQSRHQETYGHLGTMTQTKRRSNEMLNGKCLAQYMYPLRTQSVALWPTDVHLFLYIIEHKARVRKYGLMMSHKWLLFNHIMVLSRSWFWNVKPVTAYLHLCAVNGQKWCGWENRLLNKNTMPPRSRV